MRLGPRPEANCASFCSGGWAASRAGIGERLFDGVLRPGTKSARFVMARFPARTSNPLHAAPSGETR